MSIHSRIKAIAIVAIFNAVSFCLATTANAQESHLKRLWNRLSGKTVVQAPPQGYWQAPAQTQAQYQYPAQTQTQAQTQPQKEEGRGVVVRASAIKVEPAAPSASTTPATATKPATAPVAASSPASATSASPASPASQPVGDPYGFGAILNQIRSGAGLPMLAYSPNLSAYASQNNAEMCRRGLGHHINPNCFQNSGWNYADAASAAQGWMDSPAHRANMLNPNMTEFGIAYGPGPYWTLNAR